MLKNEHTAVLERFESMQPVLSPDHNSVESSVTKMQLEAAHGTITALRADLRQQQQRGHDLSEVSWF
jgi:hypothetical protein